MKPLRKHLFGSLLTVLLGGLSISASRADVILVSNDGGTDFNGTIGEYTTAGVPINPALISVINPRDIAILGSDLFVTTIDGVGEYTTDGVPVNPTLITGLNQPFGIAVLGSDLFVVSNNFSLGGVGKYTTAGADKPRTDPVTLVFSQ
jgi:hypothetical protein